MDDPISSEAEKSFVKVTGLLCKVKLVDTETWVDLVVDFRSEEYARS
jgi:hypothetical protein